MLLGDFNSVTTSSDHLSGKLDDTSHFIHTSLTQWNLQEPLGSHRYSFTYHHPAVPDRKSRLDRIYLNFEMNNTQGYSQHSSISDHYLVGLYQLPDKDKGPKLWRLLWITHKHIHALTQLWAILTTNNPCLAGKISKLKCKLWFNCIQNLDKNR